MKAGSRESGLIRRADEKDDAAMNDPVVKRIALSPGDREVVVQRKL